METAGLDLDLDVALADAVPRHQRELVFWGERASPDSDPKGLQLSVFLVHERQDHLSGLVRECKHVVCCSRRRGWERRAARSADPVGE